MKTDERPPGRPALGSSDLETLFPGMEPPGPPRELRGNVLRSVAGALTDEPRPGAWARVWQSRSFRLAWAASVLVLLAAHAVLGSLLAPKPVGKPEPLAVFRQSVPEELSDYVTLPEIRTDARTWNQTSAVPSNEQEPRNPAGPPRKEVGT